MRSVRFHWKSELWLLRAWQCPCIAQAFAFSKESQLVAVCDHPFFTMHYHLPGARTSELPFFATVFWRFMTRLCLPGMEKAWFSFPPCSSGAICWGGLASRWTWETCWFRFLRMDSSLKWHYTPPVLHLNCNSDSTLTFPLMFEELSN